MHVCDNCPELVGSNSSIPTAQVIIQSIMDEDILVLVTPRGYKSNNLRIVLQLCLISMAYYIQYFTDIPILFHAH